MELKNKLQKISRENEEKNNELSLEVFEILVGMAEQGRYDGYVKLLSKDAAILKKQGFEVIRYNQSEVYFVSWEGNNNEE